MFSEMYFCPRVLNSNYHKFSTSMASKKIINTNCKLHPDKKKKNLKTYNFSIANLSTTSIIFRLEEKTEMQQLFPR